jgi:hypothetical protein
MKRDSIDFDVRGGENTVPRLEVKPDRSIRSFGFRGYNPSTHVYEYTRTKQSALDRNFAYNTPQRPRCSTMGETVMTVMKP